MSSVLGLKDQLNNDLKQAMIARDKPLVSILRSIKSAILYKEVEVGKRDVGLEDSAIINVLKKEKKTRQDAYDMYISASEQQRADEEKYQMDVITNYLPEQMSEQDTQNLVQDILKEEGIASVEMKHMGVVMAGVKKRGAQVDGAIVSKIIKELATA